MNLSQREAATLLATLSFWTDEMLPHSRRIMRPYFRHVGFPKATPLNRLEIERLAKRLRAQFISRA